MRSTEAGGTCLILFEFVILKRDKMRNFKNWTLPTTLVVSHLKIFEILELSQGDNNSITKIRSRRFCRKNYRNSFFCLNFSSQIS